MIQFVKSSNRLWTVRMWAQKVTKKWKNRSSSTNKGSAHFHHPTTQFNNRGRIRFKTSLLFRTRRLKTLLNNSTWANWASFKTSWCKVSSLSNKVRVRWVVPAKWSCKCHRSTMLSQRRLTNRSLSQSKRPSTHRIQRKMRTKWKTSLRSCNKFFKTETKKVNSTLLTWSKFSKTTPKTSPKTRTSLKGAKTTALALPTTCNKCLKPKVDNLLRPESTRKSSVLYKTSTKLFKSNMLNWWRSMLRTNKSLWTTRYLRTMSTFRNGSRRTGWSEAWLSSS